MVYRQAGDGDSLQIWKPTTNKQLQTADNVRF